MRACYSYIRTSALGGRSAPQLLKSFAHLTVSEWRCSELLTRIARQFVLDLAMLIEHAVRSVALGRACMAPPTHWPRHMRQERWPRVLVPP